MESASAAVYRTRCAFQRGLDEMFPGGAMCAVLKREDGRLQAASLLVSTGRLFCSNARETASGDWEYEVLMDPRQTADASEDPVRLWIRGPLRSTSVVGLFEADAVDCPGEGDRLVRFNADPPDHVRPSRRARSAVTEAYEEVLFPDGWSAEVAVE